MDCFFRTLAPAILQVNEGILADRNRLLNICLDSLYDEADMWVTKMMLKYKVAKKEDPVTAECLDDVRLLLGEP